MANEEKYRLPVDVEGFGACMREQKERSRAGGKAKEGVALKFEAAETAHLQRSVPTTDDRPKCAPFDQPGNLRRRLPGKVDARNVPAVDRVRTRVTFGSNRMGATSACLCLSRVWP